MLDILLSALHWQSFNSHNSPGRKGWSSSSSNRLSLTFEQFNKSTTTRGTPKDCTFQRSNNLFLNSHLTHNFNSPRIIRQKGKRHGLGMGIPGLAIQSPALTRWVMLYKPFSPLKNSVFSSVKWAHSCWSPSGKWESFIDYKVWVSLVELLSSFAYMFLRGLLLFIPAPSSATSSLHRDFLEIEMSSCHFLSENL